MLVTYSLSLTYHVITQLQSIWGFNGPKKPILTASYCFVFDFVSLWNSYRPLQKTIMLLYLLQKRTWLNILHYHFCILFGNVDWLKTGHMTFYKKWYSMDVTNHSNTHAIYKYIIYLDFERSWWRLFQKRVMSTKFDIYVLLTKLNGLMILLCIFPVNHLLLWIIL